MVDFNSMSVSTVLVIGISLANVGAYVYLIKMVMAPLATTVGALSKSVEELYRIRTNHQDRLVSIETVHQVKGCVQVNMGGRNG
jgi:hypothetical protein